MREFFVVTGGARSGKSTLAEKITKEKGKNIVYIATEIPFDEGMKDRIKKHREMRPKEWTTIERYKNFNKIKDGIEIKNCDTVLLDCMTLMVSNLLLESSDDFDQLTMEEIDKIELNIFEEINELLKAIEDKNVIIVTNEMGLGVVPPYKLGRVFRDIGGRVNQYLANKANHVYMTVSGIPIKIK